MNKNVIVKAEWIRDAIAMHPNGGCEFHVAGDGGKFHHGCGCCQLAKAYYAAIRKVKVK